MTAALFRHAFLLLTFRHDLSGLPRRHFGLIMLLFVASAAMAWLRWGRPVMLPAHLLVLFMWYSLSPRMAVAYALASIGIDAAAIPVERLVDERDPLCIFSVWELAVVLVIAYRVQRMSAR